MTPLVASMPRPASAVMARRQLRMRWLTPFVALVVVVSTAGAASPGSVNRILNGPATSTTRHGDFELTLRSEKTEYLRGEPVVIAATLTYVGPERSVRISHPGSSPMTFGIVEPVHGLLLSGMSFDSRGSTELDRGVGVNVPFRKSFASPTELEPAALAFVRQPRLVLPPGTWHPYVVAQFSLADHGIRMQTEIAIDVLDGATWVDPSLPTTPPVTPSPTPIPEDQAVHIVNLDAATVEIVFRNRHLAWLTCGKRTVVSALGLDSSPLWNFLVRDDAGNGIGAALLDWHLPAEILIHEGRVLSGPWPMPDQPAASCG